MDYSDGTSSSLDETNLFESNNIGRGSTAGGYADWNLSGGLTVSSLSIDLNNDIVKNTLTDANDWANLSLPFSRTYRVNSGISRTSSTTSNVPNPISDDRQPVSEEVAPPQRFFDELRSVH